MYQLMKKYRLVFYIFFGLCFSIPAWANSFKLIQSYPVHHPIFIQGLQLDGSNRLIYSAGLYGWSEIGYLNLATGKTYGVKKLLPSVFAEGLTVTDDGIWQITWREQMAFLRDVKTLTIKKTVHYLGEGWGLAYDKRQKVLWLSDGSSKLQKLDAKNFNKISEISVQNNGKPVEYINELEYANGFLYANIWQSNKIIKINPNTGKVLNTYDFSPLVSTLNLTDPDSVLNGIAHIGGQSFYITGKNFGVVWQVLFTQ